jgi:hypothetical protein
MLAVVGTVYTVAVVPPKQRGVLLTLYNSTTTATSATTATTATPLLLLAAYSSSTHNALELCMAAHYTTPTLMVCKVEVCCPWEELMKALHAVVDHNHSNCWHHSLQLAYHQVSC